MHPFVGRADERRRFAAAVREAATGRAPVLVVHGHGGVGKSTLLARFAEAAAERCAVVALDWEAERQRRPAQPPIWRVLDRVYRGLVDAAATPRARRVIERAFTDFRRCVAREPELIERARALGLDGAQAAADRTKLADAATELAGVGLGVKLGPAGAPLAGAGRVAVGAAVRRWRRLEPEAYASLTDEVTALVRAFGLGLSAAGRRTGPVALLLDGCELLGDALDWLPEVVAQSGPHALWVFGLRQEPGAGPPAARLAAGLPPERVVAMPLRPFAVEEVVEYLAAAFGGVLPGGVSVEQVVTATGGVPLALELLTSFLRRGAPADEVFDAATPGAAGRQIVAGLVQRYLSRLLASPSAAADLPLVHGLALLPYGPDARLLAALWDVPPAEVAGRLAGLRERYDFVLDGPHLLHRDVAAAVLAHLAGPVERETVRAMNARAALHLRARLADPPRPAEERLADPDWRRDLLALLWHTGWADERGRDRLLGHVFAPVAVLDPSLALELMSIAGARSAPPPSTAHPDEGVFTDEAERRRFADLLMALRGDEFGLAPAARLELVEAVLAQAGGATAAAVHQRLTAWIAWLHLAEDPQVDLDLGLRAARRGAEVSPGSAAAHAVLASVLILAGEPVQAEAAVREARRLAPERRRGLTLGLALRMQGRDGEAAEVLRAAVAEEPETAPPHARRELAAALIGSGEAPALREAVDVLRRAARAWPADEGVLIDLTVALMRTGDPAAAEITARQALDIQERPETRALLALVQRVLGDADVAEFAPIDRIRHLMEVGADEEAHRELSEELRRHPDRHGLRVVEGALLNRRWRYAEAERTLRVAIAAEPDNAAAHASLAHSLEGLRRYAEAADSARTAVGCPGADPAVLAVAAAVLGEVGQFEEAAEWGALAHSRRPEVDTQVNLAFALRALGRFAEAERLLRTAAAARGGDAGVHADLAETRLFLGRPGAALHSLRRASELGGDGRTARVHALLGLLLHAEAPDLARDHLELATRVQAMDASPFRRMEMGAIAATALGRRAAAGTLAEAATQLRKPSDTFRRPFYDLLARCAPPAAVEELLTVWRRIVIADPSALGPFSI